MDVLCCVLRQNDTKVVLERVLPSRFCYTAMYRRKKILLLLLLIIKVLKNYVSK